MKPKPPLTEHQWPAPGEHLWSKWMNRSRTERYRTCLHPDCGAVDNAPVPSA